MSEAVILALIAAGASTTVAVVASVVAPVVVSRLKSIEEQVANDHRKPDGTPLNLRDDLDGKHDSNHKILTKLQSDVSWIMREIYNLRTDVDAIEDTQQKGTTSHD